MKKTFIYSFFISILLLSACSTDLDVTGDYKETMVVYGLLDQSQPVQYIKINKAFLGEGIAKDFAQIKDSTQYANSLSVTIKRVSDGTEFNLSPDNSISKDPGIFYSPDQTNVIYSFNSPSGTLPTNSQYHLIIKNTETGIETSSQTSLIEPYDIYFPSTLSNPAYSFNLKNTTTYGNVSIKWFSTKNARQYQLIARFHFVDSTATGNVSDSLDWTFLTQSTQNLAGGEDMNQSMSGESFYQFIGNNLKNNDPAAQANIIKRTAGNIELILIAASDDLVTYIDVNKPSTGIIQEKPEFTNITNGLGIFAARYYRMYSGRPLSSLSLTELKTGAYTANLKF